MSPRVRASSSRRRAALDALAPQDGLYTVVERRPDEDQAEVFAVLRQVLADVRARYNVAGDEPEPADAPRGFDWAGRSEQGLQASGLP